MVSEPGSSRVGTMFGPYEIRSLLGAGGMGEVYQAYDTSKGRTVAVKLLRPELAAHTGFQERFRRESRVAARLQEPHVIPVVAVGTALSGGPPHRSQRAELPHWAPRSGPTPVHSSTNRRTRSSTLDAPVPALCPEHVVLAAFPSRCPLPSTISAAAQRPCSTASPVLRGSPTSHDRASRACGLSLPRAARTVPGGRAIVGSPGSRA